LKLIDPKVSSAWIHPEHPEFVVTYRPVAIPTMSQDEFKIGKAYIDRGVVGVTNDGEAIPEPTGGWGGPATILTSDVQTVLFGLIWSISHLTEDERQD